MTMTMMKTFFLPLSFSLVHEKKGIEMSNYFPSVHPVFQFATASFVVYQSVFLCAYFFKGFQSFEEETDNTMKAFLIVGGAIAILLLLFSVVSTISLIHYDLTYPPEDQWMQLWLIVIMCLILAWAILSGFLFGMAHFQYPYPQNLKLGSPAYQDYTAKSILAQQVFQIGGVVAAILWILTIFLFRTGASEITTHVINQNIVAPIQSYLQQRQQQQEDADFISKLTPDQRAQIRSMFQGSSSSSSSSSAPPPALPSGTSSRSS